MIAARARRPRTLSLLVAAALAASLLLPAFAVPAVAAVPATVSGTVTDGAGAVAGAKVLVFPYASDSMGYSAVVTSTVTNASGAFTLSVPAGSYRIGATDRDHLGGYYGGGSAATASQVTVVAGGATSGLGIAMARKPVRSVSAKPSELLPMELTRTIMKSNVRVAGDRAIWQDGRRTMMASGLSSGNASESVLSSDVAAADLDSRYAFVGLYRVDVSNGQRLQVLSNEDMGAVSCDETHVAYLTMDYSGMGAGAQVIEIHDVDDPLNAAKTRAITLPSFDQEASLVPGSVGDGRVAVVLDNRRILVYDVTTGAKMRDFVAPSGDIAGAVLAGGRLVWATSQRAYAATLTAGSAAATSVIEDVSSVSDRHIESIVGDGTRVGFAENTRQAQGLSTVYVDQSLRVFDLSAGTWSTPFSQPGPTDVAPDSGEGYTGYIFDISGSRSIWVDKLSAGFYFSDLSGSEVWTADGGAPVRVDSGAKAPGGQYEAQLAGDWVAYLDDSAYPTDSGRMDVCVQRLNGGTRTKIATGEYQPFALTSSVLVYETPSDPDVPWSNENIWTYDLASGTRKQLASNMFNTQLGGWGPYVVYSGVEDTLEMSPQTLFVVDTRSSAAAKVIATSEQDWSISFVAGNGVVSFTDDAGTWTYDLASGVKRQASDILGSLLTPGEPGGPQAFSYPHLASFEMSSWDSGSESLFGAWTVGNAETGELFTADPLADFDAWQADLAGDLLGAGDQLYDIRSGDYYRLPVSRYSRVVPRPDGVVAVQTMDEDSGWEHIQLFDLSGEIAKPTERVFGANRVETSVQLSQDMTSAPAVVIATSRNFPDALAGGPLAYALGAPVLLTEPGSLSKPVADEVKRLGAGTAYVLGGTGSVSGAVDTALKGLGVSVVRIAGSNRYDTAARVAAKLREVRAAKDLPVVTTAYVATGRDFPDALSASAPAARMGAPIVLTDPRSEPAFTKAALAGVTQTLVLGASIPAAQVDSFPNALVLAGANRYDTCRKVVQDAIGRKALDTTAYAFAVGNNFPDALAAGVFAARGGFPLMLVDAKHPASVPETTLAFVSANKSKLAGAAAVVGSEATLPLQLEQRIAQALQ